MIGVVISTIIVAALAYPGIEIAAKSSLVLTIVEAAVVLLLSGTILIVLTGRGRVDFTPFNPAQSLHGSHGLFGGFIFGLLAFVGFGVIATAAEETHSPRTVIPRAMVFACVILGLFWALTSWAFCLALPPDAWADYVAKGINPVAEIARKFWHTGALLVILTAILAALGVYLGSVVGYARIAYAMGRDGTLPAFLGRLHPKYQVPWNAQHLAFFITLLVAAVWGRWLGTYLSFDWWGSAVVFFAMVSNIVVNIGCSTFFYRFRREQTNWLWHALVPFLGVVASCLPLYYSFGPDLWNAGWNKGQSIIIFCVATVFASLLYTFLIKLARPEALRRASFETEV
jgi:amino acid transporter